MYVNEMKMTNSDHKAAAETEFLMMSSLMYPLQALVTWSPMSSDVITMFDTQLAGPRAGDIRGIPDIHDSLQTWRPSYI